MSGVTIAATAPPEAAIRAAEPSDTGRPTAWGRLDWALLALITLAAAAIRFVSLGRPVELVFDEIFYARDACWYVAGTESVCNISGLVSRAHPPLGKWLIGSGIAVFGYDPFGWRVAVAAAGTVTVPALHLLAWRLLRGVATPRGTRIGAAVAAALLGVDLLAIVQSRVAMLDAFITLFVVVAVLAVVLDRDDARNADRPGWRRLALGRPWRLLAGVALGAAAAVKWSGAYVAPGVIGLVVVWSIVAARREDPGRGLSSAVVAAIRREAFPTAVLLGIVPLVVYLASYAGRMPGELLAAPWDPESVWNGIWQHGRAMLDFHTQLGGDHPYQSPPWAWPLLQRPVAYWFADEGGTYREILALGNPVVWWPGLAAMAGLAVTWWRSGWRWMRPEPVILGAAASTYLPWMILSGDRSQTFLWYFLPTVPFLCLALGTFVAWAWERTAGRAAVAAFGLAVIGSVAFWLPVTVALPLEPEGWRTRMLFRDCDRPDGVVQELPDDSSSDGTPPDGWCWI